MARLLEGRPIAQRMKAALFSKVVQLTRLAGRPLVLASVAASDNARIECYTKVQRKRAQELGIEYRCCVLPGNAPEEDFIRLIGQLNGDPTVNGIILEMPLPERLNFRKLSACIAIEKDVEGMHPCHMGNLLYGAARIIPCTAAAVMELLAETAIDVRGKEAVIIGHSEIVGKPVGLMLLNQLATVTTCHIATSEAGRLKEHACRADILIVAVGKAGLVQGDWIKPGAVVIDVGINKAGDRIVGDVEFEAATGRAGWITPVPGGVGPLTVMILMRNFLALAEAGLAG